MSNSSRIWFHLYGSDGMPYKGTNADKVMLPHGSVVAQFRDAVKAKNSDSILKGIAPSSLSVFKNKDSFKNKVSMDVTHYRKCRSSHHRQLMVWDRQWKRRLLSL